MKIWSNLCSVSFEFLRLRFGHIRKYTKIITFNPNVQKRTFWINDLLSRYHKFLTDLASHYYLLKWSYKAESGSSGWLHSIANRRNMTYYQYILERIFLCYIFIFCSVFVYDNNTNRFGNVWYNLFHYCLFLYIKSYNWWKYIPPPL